MIQNCWSSSQHHTQPWRLLKESAFCLQNNLHFAAVSLAPFVLQTDAQYQANGLTSIARLSTEETGIRSLESDMDIIHAVKNVRETSDVIKVLMGRILFLSHSRKFQIVIKALAQRYRDSRDGSTHGRFVCLYRVPKQVLHYEWMYRISSRLYWMMQI